VNTAEKRAQLEARGEPWPDCLCHGVRMDWNSRSKAGRGEFRCRVRSQERVTRLRAARRHAGVCVQCGGVLATESMCESCAARHRDAAWRHEQSLKRQLDKYLDNLRRHNRDREFQPTEAGQAALAAYINREV